MSGHGEVLPIAVAGCDFRLASTRFRSRLVLDEREREALVGELARSAGVDGFADLVTCNRCEWIVSTTEPAWAAQIMRAQMIDRLSTEGIEPYVNVGAGAARHLFSVSIGQESFVVGERQIATQFFAALEKARSLSTSSRILNGMGTITGRLVRDAVREGCIGAPALGVHSLACRHVREWLGRGSGRTVAVVGLGAIGRLVRGVLEADPELCVVPVNRSVPPGEEGRVRPLRDLARVLAEVDAAVVCTSAPHPVVRAGTIEGRDPARPLLLLDLGIPEQVQETSPGSGAVRAGLDDLTADPSTAPSAEEQRRHREDAERLVGRALGELEMFARERSVVEILDEVRRLHERFVAEEIPAIVGERAADLDESRRAHLVFALRGKVLEYTNEVFRALKRSLRDGEEEDWKDVP